MPKKIATLKKRSKYWYGESQADIRPEIVRFSTKNTYVASAFADAVCVCGGKTFALSTDEDAGVAVRSCKACETEHVMADGAEFLDDAEVEANSCVCAAEAFEVTVGVALYEGSEDVKWLYVGCRCTACGLVGVFGHWKNEFCGYRELLAQA